MNVLKLLRCFWKHPISRTDFRAVNYYVQYERVDHIANQVIENPGPLRFVSKHEDIYDQEIYQNLYDTLSAIPNIQQFKITTDESLLFNEFEEKARALTSNVAYGYDFTNLQINTLDNQIARLATRIYFTDANNPIIQNAILPAIPLALNLNINGTIPSLIRADFLDRQTVERILDRQIEIDLSRFQQ